MAKKRHPYLLIIFRQHFYYPKMQKQLLIIFVKNIVLGKVKTRLAKTIGNSGAFNVYKALYNITQTETLKIDVDRHIYFSDIVINSSWPNDEKFVQNGNGIGERMLNAFKDGFDKGYEQIILIGSDLPDISERIINTGFNALKHSEIVFGPAQDGGYYLVGMNKMSPNIFLNKPWSQPNLLKETLTELYNYSLLNELNHKDTIDDQRASHLNNQFSF